MEHKITYKREGSTLLLGVMKYAKEGEECFLCFHQVPEGCLVFDDGDFICAACYLDWAAHCMSYRNKKSRVFSEEFITAVEGAAELINKNLCAPDAPCQAWHLTREAVGNA